MIEPAADGAAKPVFHGGGLDEAIARHGGARAEWIDLSTGINPVAPPLPVILPDDYARLPGRALEAAAVAAARGFFGFAPAAHILPVAGIQGVISLLPQMRPAGLMALVSPTYGEYAPAFTRGGWDVRTIAEIAEIADETIVLAVNPNNPDGRMHSPDALLALADRLTVGGGLLIVDEAFGDVVAGLSLAAHAGRPGLMVLKSFGKLFGLGGLRIGFAAGDAADMARLAALVGPWSVNGPALRIAAELMAEPGMLDGLRAGIAARANAQAAVLSESGLALVADVRLFHLTETGDARALHQALLRHHILTRVFDAYPRWMRFGLCADETQRNRLAVALKACLSAAP